jgi:hypothetical protein
VAEYWLEYALARKEAYEQVRPIMEARQAQRERIKKDGVRAMLDGRTSD